MRDFEKIYNAYFRDVYRYLLRLSANEHLAEELTSDTFFRAMRALPAFRGDCDIRVWLCGIAKNCYYSYTARHKPPLPAEAAEHIPDTTEEDMIESIDRRLTCATVQRVLHTIEEPYREVFMWRVYAELSFREIGALFGKNENWACVTYHRAKQKLLKKIGDDPHDN